MNTIHQFVIFLEGKKTVLGSIAFYVFAFLLGRHLLAPDVMALIAGILGTLGIAVVGVSSTDSYQAQLGASKTEK